MSRRSWRWLSRGSRRRHRHRWAGLGSALPNKVTASSRDVHHPTLARYAREHNGANVLTLGATLLSTDAALAIVDTWLATPMTEPRYIRRLARIHRLESKGSAT